MLSDFSFIRYYFTRKEPFCNKQVNSENKSIISVVVLNNYKVPLIRVMTTLILESF